MQVSALPKTAPVVVVASDVVVAPAAVVVAPDVVVAPAVAGVAVLAVVSLCSQKATADFSRATSL